MRRLLTGGIKAILAVAILSTAAHWVLRMQRDPAPDPAAQIASRTGAFPDPETTGSIAPRAAAPAQTGANPTVGLDQQHLSALIASHSEKAGVQKTSARR